MSAASARQVAFHLVDEPDPRAELARHDDLDADELATITRRLERLDRAAAAGPWTATVLRRLAAHPDRRAGDLAAMLGRETAPFQLAVRKLKNLGLTLSQPIGYQLSPRGTAYLRAIDSTSRQSPAPGAGAG